MNGSLLHAHGAISLSRCLVMGIVNRTPDSFYDGGRTDLSASVSHALTLVEEGADVLDLGGVKAGPGPMVSREEEMERLIPLVRALVQRTGVPLSVETGGAEVAAAALQAGAAIINDVSGLVDENLASVCAASGAGLVLMHNGGQIRGRPRNPRYEDVVGSVLQSWQVMAARARAEGVKEQHMIVDPGLDFGKTTWHSLELMRRLPELLEAGYPLLVAPSRKDIVGETLDLPLQDRLEGTLALVALAVAHGAHIVRVHDVAAAVRTARMVEAVAGSAAPVAALRGLWE